MNFEFSTHDLPDDPNLAEFARVSVLFEVWRPRHPWRRLAVDLSRVRGDAARVRCRVAIESDGLSLEVTSTREDAFAAVLAAAALLGVRCDERGPSASVSVPSPVVPLRARVASGRWSRIDASGEMSVGA